MPKVTLLNDPLYSVTNTNNDRIEAAIENMLSRDGETPNEMNANLDMNSNRIINLPDAVGVTEPVTLGQASVIAGVDVPLTTENVLAVLDDQDIGELIYPRTATEISVGITPVNYTYPEGNVLRYGTNTTPGTTNMAPAIQAAWDVMSRKGGTVYIPPGKYHCTETLEFHKPLNGSDPYDNKITVYGYGAELSASAAVTGFQIELYRYYNQFGIQLEGLRFNHRFNSTIQGCIKVTTSSHYIIRDCAVEFGQNHADYRAIEVGPSPGGTSDTNSFWGLIEGFGTRLRTGADGPAPNTAILLRGAANSTTIRNCAFNNVRDAIVFEPDCEEYDAGHPAWPAGANYWLTPGSTNDVLPNGVRIYDNAFEAMSGSAVKVIAEKTVGITTFTSEYGPSGLFIGHNRIEDLGSVLEFSGNPPSAGDHSHPPIVENNYAVNGYSTQYVINPNNERYFSINPHYFHDGNAFPAGQGTRVGGTGDYIVQISNDQPGNFIIRDYSGYSTYSSAHIVLGTYHLWVDTSTGKLMLKDGAPANQSDGTIVGTQS